MQRLKLSQIVGMLRSESLEQPMMVFERLEEVRSKKSLEVWEVEATNSNAWFCHGDMETQTWNFVK